MTRVAGTDSPDYLRAIEDAAEMADLWAIENFRLASDTIHLDPVLSGRAATVAAMAESEQLTLDGALYAARAHAAQDVARAIRALGSRPA